MPLTFSIDPTTLRETPDDPAAASARVAELEAAAPEGDGERVSWLRMLGRLDEAEAVARAHFDRTALGRDPLPLDAIAPAVRLAQVALLQGRPEEAAPLLERAIIGSRTLDPYGPSDAGVDQLDELVQRRRLEAFALQHRGRLRYELGQAGPAAEDFASALALRQQSAVPQGEVEASRQALAAAELARRAASPRTYDHALRGVRGWWRGALALVSLIVGFLIVSTILGVVVIGIEAAIDPSSLDGLARGEITLTPGLMLANNLGLAALIPLSMLLQWAFYGVRPGYLSSITGRFRWRWFGRAALVIVPAWALYVGLSFVLTPVGEFSLDGTAIAMLVIVVLTTPLQSAGEEYASRGLIQRAVGSWFPSQWAGLVVGAIVSGSVFAAAHGTFDPWLLAYYVGFAFAMTLTARWTGGLEVPVLVHVVNNVLLLIPTALAGQTGEVFDRGVGTGTPLLLLPLVLLVGVVLFSRWWARRARVATIAPTPPTSRRDALRLEPSAPGSAS